MFLYRTLRSFNQGYRLTAMWILITAMVIAMFFMFVHPFGTIILFWLGLIVLGLAVLAGKPMVLIQHAVARKLLAQGQCPRCGGGIDEIDEKADEDDAKWSCARCSIRFLTNGEERRTLEESQ